MDALKTEAVKADWETQATRLIKSELAKKGIRYSELRKRMAGLGIDLSEGNIRNRVSRGGFSAAFLLAVLTAIGTTEIRL